LAQAHILALEALAGGAVPSIYNLGNGNGYSVLEVVQATEKVVGKPLPKAFIKRRAGDPAILVASAERIKRELHWKPCYSDMQTIIETAWRWHQKKPLGYAKY
jgi:UDP-glucose 4-epimerase